MTKDGKPHLTLVQRRLLDAHTDIVSRLWGEDFHLSFNHSFLCSVNLPYRNPGDDVRRVQTSSGSITLRLEAGSVHTRDGGFKDIGLPYGARARLLLLHLCSVAVRTGSPVIEVRDSFTGFAKELGLSINGQSLKSFKNQVSRMSVVSMKLARQQENFVDVFQGQLFSKLRAEFPKAANQRTLWATHIEFNNDFYQSLKKHAVPLDTQAIAALKHSARALDVYCWLASRLYRVHPAKPVQLRWTTLRLQFGDPTQSMVSFKRRFKQALEQVMFVYPAAAVETVYGGIELRHSPPPVPFKEKGILG